MGKKKGITTKEVAEIIELKLTGKNEEQKANEIMDFLEPPDKGGKMKNEDYDKLPDEVKAWHVKAVADSVKRAEAVFKSAKKKDAKKKKELVVADKWLPATIEELRDFILIGKEKLKAQKAKIKAIETVNLAYAAKAAALSDAQDLAEILLDAEIRLGWILRTDADSGKRAKSSKSSGETRKLKDYGLTKKQSHHAQLVADNVDVVNDVRKAARAEGRIATSNDVVKEIKKRKAPSKEVKKQTPKQLLKDELIAKAFERSFTGFFKALKEARQEGWKKTSEKAARIHVDMLVDFLKKS